MIAKQVPMRSVQKSSFSGLVRYITDSKDKEIRLTNVSVANCHSDDVEMATTEILLTQEANNRATGDKTYHLIVSFPAGEEPDVEILKNIEEKICQGLGYGEHQRISVVHDDTDNLHMHIAINKIHPERHTIHTPYNDHLTLGRLCKSIEQEFSLQLVNHEAEKRGAAGRAQDMERHSGMESLLGWIRRECLGQLREAKSWEELHKTLHSHGLEMKARGNGLVVTSGDGTTIKASSLGREFSKARLEKQFGASFRTPDGIIKGLSNQTYKKAPRPMRMDSSNLYAIYTAEQESHKKSREQALLQAQRIRDRNITAEKRSALLKRSSLKFAKGAVAKKIAYASISNTLKKELESIKNQYRKDKDRISSRYRRQTWADWLREQASAGNKEALEALRAREGRQKLAGNIITGNQKNAGLEKYDSITKQGTIIYSAAGDAVRDDGAQLKVSRWAEQESLQVALKMASARYGSHLKVSGTDVFKEKIARAAAAARLPVTFDDPALEKRRQEMMKSRFAPKSARENREAAQKFVAEMNKARSKEVNIPKHKLYNPTKGEALIFGGLRKVDGQALVLLAGDGDIQVLPVDSVIEARFGRANVGEPVSVTAAGNVTRKGRGIK